MHRTTLNLLPLLSLMMLLCAANAFAAGLVVIGGGGGGVVIGGGGVIIGGGGGGGASLSISSPTSLSAAMENLAYATGAATAANGSAPYTWSISGEPDGLTVSSTTGAISGTPEWGTAGTYTVTLRVTDSASATATRNLSLTVNEGLEVTTTELPVATPGAAYTTTVVAAGGTEPYAFSAAGLPGTLSIDPATGVITGTAPMPFTSPVTVTISVTDAVPQTIDVDFILTPYVPELIITTSSMTNAYSGVAYSMTFASTGGLAPLAWSATGLPVGLSLDALTGVVSGTVVAGDEGDYTVRVTATDNNSPADSDTFVYYFGVYVVGETPLSIVETSMPTGDVGDFYSFTFTAAGGSGTYEWIGVNGLPSGMDAEFDSATGEVTVSGEPLNGGTFYVNVQVIDSNSEVTSQMYTFVVSESSSSSSSSGGNSAPVQAVPNLVGGGCSVNGSGSFNVVLALMALVLAGAVVGRRMMLPIGSRS